MCDVSIATCFLGGGGVVVAKMLALYAFDKSYTPPSQDKAGFSDLLILIPVWQNQKKIGGCNTCKFPWNQHLRTNALLIPLVDISFC